MLKNKVSLKDIARELNITINSVSRALSDKEKTYYGYQIYHLLWKLIKILISQQIHYMFFDKNI